MPLNTGYFMSLFEINEAQRQAQQRIDISFSEVAMPCIQLADVYWEPIKIEKETKKTPKNSNEAIRKFATFPLYQAMAMVKCGFELETQSVNGKTSAALEDASESNNDNQIDYDTMHSVAYDRAYNILNNNKKHAALDTYTKFSYRWRDAVDVVWLEHCVTSTLENSSSLQDFLTLHDRLSLENLLIELINSKASKRLYSNLLEQLEQEEFGDLDSDNYIFESENDNILNWGNSLEYFRLDDIDVELEADGSVAGPEIKTLNGGVSPRQFVSIANQVFKHDLVIDEGCSFHTHISIEGVKHSYGKQLQIDLYTYLIEHYSEVPESVKQRWQNEEKRNKYFGLNIQDEKFTFVNCHSQGTWEFRCFGNVKNAKDARQCLMLAIKAMRYAYQCKLGLIERIQLPENDIGYLVIALENERSVTTQIRICKKENANSRSYQRELQAA